MQVIDDEICYRWSEYENMCAPLDLTTVLLLRRLFRPTGMHAWSKLTLMLPTLRANQAMRADWTSTRPGPACTAACTATGAAAALAHQLIHQPLT